MRTITATFDDGTSVQYNNVPDEVTPEQVLARLKNEYPKRTVSSLDGGRGAPAEAAAPPPAVDQTPLAPRMEPNLRNAAPVTAGASPEFQNNLDLSRQLARLQAQKAALYSVRGMTPVQKQQAFNDLNNQIEALRQQVPTDLADVGGTVGNVVGGVGAGLAAAPAAPATAGVGTALASAAGATAGGFLGRAAGAYAQMARSNFNDAEKAAYLDDKLGLKNILIDAAGNLVFMGAGGALGAVGRNTAFGRAILRDLGFMVKQAVPGEASAMKPAFGEAGSTAHSTITSKAELDAAAARAAETLSTGEVTATKGAITGAPSRVEDLAKRLNPADVKARQEALNAELEKRLADYRGLIEGQQAGETPGHTLEKAFNGLEQRVKAFASNAYGRLRDIGSDVGVDISAIRAAAKARLENAAPGTVPPGEKTALENILKNPDVITPEAAHDLQSVLGAESRDLAKPGALDTRHKKAIDMLAQDIRDALSTALDNAATNADRQMAMFGPGNAAAQAERASAVRAGEAARGTPEALPPTTGEQTGMFPAGQGELLPSGDVAAAQQAAAAANAARAGKISAADAAQAGAEGRLAAGTGEQKAMFGEAPKIDPRLPEDLRKAADAYRTMAQSVESSTGKKVLTAAETTGPEQVGAKIYAKGSTTPIAEIRNLIDVAKKVDALPIDAPAAKALRDKAERMGFDVSRPLEEQFREAHNGLVAEFMAKHMSTAEQLRNLPKTLADPANRRLFEAMLPGKQNRLLMEELSQQAQIIHRMGDTASSLIGANHALQLSLGGGAATAAALGAPAAAATAAAGVAAFMLAPKALAFIALRPAYRAELSRILALNARIGQGASGSTLAELANDFADKMKAEGYDIRAPK